MTAEEFVRKHGKVHVNGPKYRGGPNPPFEDDRINESEFSDDLRVKSLNIDTNYYNVISIDWESQAWDDNFKDFIIEVKRCYNYLANKFGLEEKVEIIIHLHDRDDTGSTNISFNIGEY